MSDTPSEQTPIRFDERLHVLRAMVDFPQLWGLPENAVDAIRWAIEKIEKQDEGE